MVCWLTGFDESALGRHLAEGTTFEEFFAAAHLNPSARSITGVVCGVRVEDVDDPLMQRIRYLDKLVVGACQGEAAGQDPAGLRADERGRVRHGSVEALAVVIREARRVIGRSQPCEHGLDATVAVPGISESQLGEDASRVCPSTDFSLRCRAVATEWLDRPLCDQRQDVPVPALSASPAGGRRAVVAAGAR